jgi:hypothetical protein
VTVYVITMMVDIHVAAKKVISCQEIIALVKVRIQFLIDEKYVSRCQVSCNTRSFCFKYGIMEPDASLHKY